MRLLFGLARDDPACFVFFFSFLHAACSPTHFLFIHSPLDTLALRTYAYTIWQDEGSLRRKHHCESGSCCQIRRVDKKPTQREELAGRTAGLNKFLAASVAQNSKLEERRLSGSFLNVPTLQSQKFQVGRSEEPWQTQIQNSGASLLVHPERNLHVKLSISRCMCKDEVPHIALLSAGITM